LEISDWINVVLCILSFVLAVISVITVIITLKQNSKMIKNSTRPYVVAYKNITYFQNTNYYIILKNFGQTGAVIEKFKFNIDLQNYSHLDGDRIFEHIEGTFIAPQQSVMACVDTVKLFKDGIDIIEFTITYSDGINKYNEKYKINFLADTDTAKSRASTDGKELKIISYTLQDFVERLL